jgi:hypothetical protein
MNENTTTVLDAVREMTHYSLANNAADISSPDSDTSPGAKFLGRVRDSVIESLEWKVEHDTDGDLAQAARALREDSHELADGAVPVYTYERWQTFVDLTAWQVDITEFGETEDMTSAAGVALYEVARVLTDALCEYVETYWSELEDTGEQDDDQDQDLDADPSE